MCTDRCISSVEIDTRGGTARTVLTSIDVILLGSKPIRGQGQALSDGVIISVSRDVPADTAQHNGHYVLSELPSTSLTWLFVVTVSHAASLRSMFVWL